MLLGVDCLGLAVGLLGDVGLQDAEKVDGLRLFLAQPLSQRQFLDLRGGWRRGEERVEGKKGGNVGRGRKPASRKPRSYIPPI